MPANRLSKAAEAKLMAAIASTADAVNSGAHPDAAIAKSAQAHGIPPGHINVMTHAYNTGRTTKQRETGTSPLEKAADFELADASKVLELLYPEKSQIKTAGAVRQSAAVSTEYALPPSGILARHARREKQAAQIDWAQLGGQRITPPPAYPADPKTAMKRAACTVDRSRHEVDESRRRMSAAFDKMAQTFTGLTGYLRRTDAPPIPAVREQAFMLHGGKAVQLIDQLVRVTPGLNKFAGRRLAPTDPTAAPDGVVFSMISQMFDEIEDYQRKKAAFEELAAEKAAEAEVLLRPFAVRGRSVLEDFWNSDERALSKSAAGSGIMPFIAGGLAKDVLGGVASQMQPPESSAMSQGSLDALTDPHHEARLRNIRTQANLQDLMANDPVISGYDPQEVLTAFNNISEAAPRAADQRMLMQALLRKQLQQGAADPFEVDQILGMEGKMQKRDAGVYGERGGGGGDGSVI